MASSSSSQSQPKLSIQSFHQCSSLISIKLTSNNYLIWKSQVLPLVRSLGLEHHVITDASFPSTVNTDDGKKVHNPEFLQWQNNDGLLMTWLRGMMSEEVLSMVTGGLTAREVWLAIEEQMLSATKEQESWLKDSFYSLKKGSLKLQDLTKKFKNICDQLAAIGKPIADEDQVFQLARSLGPQYADFKTAMMTKPPYPNMKRFVLALQNHEQTIVAQREVNKSAQMNYNEAFFGQRGRGGKNQRGGRYNNFRGRDNGGGRGNVNNQNKLNSQPPLKQNKVTNQQEQEEEIIYQICGKKNHSAVNCWYRYDYFDEEDIPKALAAMNLQDRNDPKLYADWGATSHMTNNKGNIDKPVLYKGNDKRFVGNGQGLHITHVGNASLNTDYGKLKLNNVLVVPKLKKNLLSVGQLIKDNKCSFEFNSDGFVVKNQEKQETRHIVEFPSCDEWLELTSATPISQDTKSNHTICHAHAQKECLGISNPHAIPPQIQMPLAQAAVPRLSTLIFGSPATLSSTQPQNVLVTAPIDNLNNNQINAPVPCKPVTLQLLPAEEEENSTRDIHQRQNALDPPDISENLVVDLSGYPHQVS
ncbi:hypothetical protein WN944_006343 [Citrus x changshan-huyou]|uniref:Retrovirus-related Pol polyprotein from transposon TNT 1-94-like beta-barrel domain-containing protein n=1 Tax=Citrus x changshan-huyou TaxID=2935761 RepID=A0AAP0MJ10_9ROSI